jgi:hypothetical protein
MVLMMPIPIYEAIFWNLMYSQWGLIVITGSQNKDVSTVAGI